MNDRDLSRDVGMGVDLRGATMGCPARVPDADRALQRLFSERRFQVSKLADCPKNSDFLPVEDRQARRVVATVFKPAQPVQEQRGALRIPDVSNDSAHVGDGTRFLR